MLTPAEHLPAVKATKSLALKAVYSRSKTSAELLAKDCPEGTSVYYDDPKSPSNSLSALLARDDIKAVIVALPILVQPEVIKAALTAGKSVLSEKPIAADIAKAEDLIKFHKQLGPKAPIWSVAENFRFLDATVYAANEIQKIGGKLCTFRASVNIFVDENDKFFNTEW
jgi:predicted dehydrogenase